MKIRDLTQQDILGIRERITNKTALRHLAEKLEVDRHVVESEITNNRTYIQEAAYEVLIKRRLTHGCTKVAFNNMYHALCDAGLREIANDVLGQQKEDVEDEHNENAPHEEASTPTEPEPERHHPENEADESVWYLCVNLSYRIKLYCFLK